MFDRLKKAFSSMVKGLSEKEISEADVDRVFSEMELALLESDVAQETVAHLHDTLRKALVGKRFDKSRDTERIVKDTLKDIMLSIFSSAGSVDVIGRIKDKGKGKEPYIILFLGINGTGKTTTIAKFANMLRKHGISSVIVAGDTHRAGAIEQITEHANRLGVKVIAQRYGADPAAVGRDGVLYARAHRVDAVLIDTAGRMQTSKNLMDEMAKIVRVVKPDLKIFVGDSLAGNDTIMQAKEFQRYTDFNAIILTKSDSDYKGGSALSIVHVTNRPILYLGVGQGYDDLVEFNAREFVEQIVEGNSM
ncbi:MAG: signal recognition particle-docking protein FtsY [Candidatus Nitrosocaldus sp.]|nr:signal recognition particle-docking protein FtsY [Candidatus Nitrosocaldus sp.]MCS7141283.1 signal recognition particle-docking protein FtsY [Candidatus Nitrosocaldus sp.]MDW8000248.1 signal recognition particle-docking protein FtsY [Candidatus Nitrosocaldus sp.]MDW8276120.1 signal recognition particle-docking protein FtsY [Candidatus Nitrosocaldus sp.]